MDLLPHEWLWEDDEGLLKSFKANISSELDKLSIGKCYTMYFGNKQYGIKKVSKNKCVQRNMQTNYTRNVVLKQLTENQNNNNQYTWYLKDENGQMHAHPNNISFKIEKLKVEQSYFLFADDSLHEIRKIAQDKCTQTDMQTYHSCEVVRKNMKMIHYPLQDDIKQGFENDKWYWVDDKDTYNAFDVVISDRINDLNIGESMMNNVMNSKYKLTKLSKNHGKQTNIKSNNVREIRRMSLNEMQNSNQKANKSHQNNNSNHNDNNAIYDDEKKTSFDEPTNLQWYFKDDNSKFIPIDNWLSDKINNLTIGEIMKQKLKSSTYEFKKTNIGKGTQRNTNTNKIREIRIAEYGWFFEDNNKSLKPYSDNLNNQLNSISINESFTCCIAIHKYSVRKVSKNHAIQKNLSTKVERNVVKKMILNEDNENDNTYETKSSDDWLQKRYAVAMRSGKIDRVTLVAKRELYENSADAHYRTCESQFARSCDKMGKESNGLNKTITGVEYIINPKLIKRFCAKKKKLMVKNKCKESDLNIILAWHGTPSANLKNIVENNFDISKLGDNKKNTGYYGCGIYFSEYARISNVYGDGLLLCKLILGKQYQMKFGKPEIGKTLEPGYDSHVAVKNKSEYGREICLFDVDQILPCYIVKY